MLAAGFVTVASADSLECTTNPSNQCCIDVSQMLNVMADLPTHAIFSADGYYVTRLSLSLINGGGVACEDEALYSRSLKKGLHVGNFHWTAGEYENSLVRVSNNSSAK